MPSAVLWGGERGLNPEPHAREGADAGKICERSCSEFISVQV